MYSGLLRYSALYVTIINGRTRFWCVGWCYNFLNMSLKIFKLAQAKCIKYFVASLFLIVRYNKYFYLWMMFVQHFEILYSFRRSFIGLFISTNNTFLSRNHFLRQIQAFLLDFVIQTVKRYTLFVWIWIFHHVHSKKHWWKHCRSIDLA